MPHFSDSERRTLKHLRAVARKDMRVLVPDQGDLAANALALIHRLATAAPQSGRAPRPNLSAEAINALPELVRHYIMWLETDADPAGTLGDNWRLTQENAALRKMVETGRAPQAAAPATTALAHCYLISKANEAIGTETAQLLSQWVAPYGLSIERVSVSQRGRALPIKQLNDLAIHEARELSGDLK